MTTEIREITVGTRLKRVKTDKSPCMTEGKTYEVVRIGTFGAKVINNYGNEWSIDPALYEIVGHVDDDIIEELDQMLEINLLRNRAVAIIGHVTGSPLGFGVLTEEEFLSKLYQNITGSK